MFAGKLYELPKPPLLGEVASSVSEDDGEVVPRSTSSFTPTPFPLLPWYDISKGGGCIKTVIYLDVLLLTNFVLGALFLDRKSTRLNSSHASKSRMPSSA